MLVPIHVLLAFIYPKSPHLYNPFSDLSLPCLSLESLFSSPTLLLHFSWRSILQLNYCLPDYTYWVGICLSQWTVKLQWTTISFYTSLLLLQHFAQFPCRAGANKSLLELNKIHKLCKITLLDGFLLKSWNSPAFRETSSVFFPERVCLTLW